VKTFSIGFPEPEWSELEPARRVAEHFGTDHHEALVTPDAVGMLDRLVAHFDEPFADVSALPTWHVSELAGRHVKVVLSGDGGDELFGGYDRYLPHPRVVRFDRFGSPALRRAAGVAAARLPRGVRGRNFLRHVARDLRGRYLDAIGFFTDEDKAALLAPAVLEGLSGARPETRLAAHFARYAALPWESQMMRFDMETYLPEDILTKVDRMSMAHSIESRVPLLDNEMLRVAASLPAELKIRDGQRKRVLKAVAAKLLPPDVLERRKQGFAVPIEAWFRGTLRDLAADTLLSARSAQRGYFQPAFVRRLLDEHLSGARDHALRLWQLVVFERWHEQYVDRTSGTPFPISAPSIPLAHAAGAS
jgi:asparagine synthase (glutamine-hydrolysing)